MRYLLALILLLPGWALAAVTGGTVLQSTTGTTKTLSCPAAASGNARVVASVSDGNGQHFAPSGGGTWTQIGTNGASVGVYAQTATGSDTNPSLNITTTTNQVAQCFVITNGDTTNIASIVDVSNVSALSSGTLIRLPALTPTANNETILWIGKSANTWTSVATASGFTETADVGSTSVGFVTAYQIQTTATAVPQTDLAITGGFGTPTNPTIVIAFKASGSSGPAITSVSGDNVLTSTETNLHVIGTGFGASQGTGSVQCVDGAMTSTFTVDSWSATDIQVDAVQGNCRFGSRSIKVTTNGGGVATKAVSLSVPTGECSFDMATLIPFSTAKGHPNRFGDGSNDIPNNSQIHIRGIVRSSGTGCTGLTVESNGRFHIPVAVTSFGWRWNDGLTGWKSTAPSRTGQNRVQIASVGGFRDSCPECDAPPDTIPDPTHTACRVGCNYTDVQLASAAISQRQPDDILELRTTVPGALEIWPRMFCNGTSGTSGHEITVRVRQGDHIIFSSAAGTDVGMIDWNNCHYWIIDGGLEDRTGLQVGNIAEYSIACARDNRAPIFNCYTHRRSVIVRNGSSHIAFLNQTWHGSGTGSGLNANDFWADSGYILIRNVDANNHGANQGVKADGTYEINDSGDLIWLQSHHTVVIDSILSRGGHKLISLRGPWQVARRNVVSNYWGDFADVPPRNPSSRGNHTLEVNSGNHDQRHGTIAFPNDYGPVVVEDNELYDSGADGERGTWNYSMEMWGIGVIVRGNYLYNKQITTPVSSMSSTCGLSFGNANSVLPFTEGSQKVYHNTVYGHAGVFQVDQDTAFPSTADSRNCSGFLLRNNIFQGMFDGRIKGSTTVSWVKKSMTVLPKGTYANDWRDGVYDWNIGGGPGTNAQFSLGGNGAGTVSWTDCTKWPANVCNNTLANLKFANGTTVPDKTKAGFALHPSNTIGLGDAAPLTKVSAVGSGTSFTVADPLVLKDDFEMGSYTWGGNHREYGDWICVGPAANSKITECNPTQIADGGNPRTGVITVQTSVTRAVNSPIWLMTTNDDGTRGVVWKNRGAVQ